VSLHTGLLQAGVAGVVASYWAVSDDAAALLMVRFYDRWKAAGNPPADPPRQAQRWLRNTTNREKLAWLTAAADAGWLPRDAAAALADAVPGGDPDGRAFEHPARWAAFAYAGT
jgi:CHAT domain-containing protein